jgi:hypothetical protein
MHIIAYYSYLNRTNSASSRHSWIALSTSYNTLTYYFLTRHSTRKKLSWVSIAALEAQYNLRLAVLTVTFVKHSFYFSVKRLGFPHILVLQFSSLALQNEHLPSPRLPPHSRIQHLLSTTPRWKPSATREAVFPAPYTHALMPDSRELAFGRQRTRRSATVGLPRTSGPTPLDLMRVAIASFMLKQTVRGLRRTCRIVMLVLRKWS